MLAKENSCTRQIREQSRGILSIPRSVEQEKEIKPKTRAYRRLLGTGLIFIALVAMAQAVRAETADTLFANGNIYTVNERQPHADAIAVKGGRIIFVGSTAEAQKFADGAGRVIDLHGATVLPGLTDSHYHILGVGEREMTLNLEGVTSLHDFLARVKERVDATERGRWITGRGWIETFWKPPTFPTRADLDTIAPGHPVFLERADGHGAVANSAALKIAGITKETPSPFGGEIVKEKATGEPAGMLLDNAMELIAKHIPQPSAAER